MPKLDEFGKTVFEEETPHATQGALSFHRQAKTPIQSAEVDGVLVAKGPTPRLALPPPWCFFPTDQPEVLLELKMRGDKTDKHALKRALLQRQAWEFHRYETEEDFSHDIPLWVVSAHLPRWLSSYVTVKAVARGVYQIDSPFFAFYWVVSNELPLEEALIPFLVTRDSGPLEEFCRWVAQKRPPEWVLFLLEVFKMRREFVEEVMRSIPETDDPELRAQRAFIAKSLLAKDPLLQAELRQESRQEGRAEGEKEAFRHLLELKLGRELSAEEAQLFAEELRRQGTDAVGKLLLTADLHALEALVHPKATPPVRPEKKT